MLHLRVISPAGSTEQALERLRAQPGTAHLVVHRGAALAPAGDLIEADVAREAADEVIDQLCGLDIDHHGGITLEAIDTALSDAADKAEEDAPGESADAVVWEELLSTTGEESRLNATFQAFLVIACLLASVGVITDSPVTIVGAMVVGPEFGPLAAVALGLVLRRWDLLRRACLALAVGFPVAMVVTGLVTLLSEWVGLLDVTDFRSGHQAVDFVYDVGWYSLIVALLAGAAGMLAMTSAKSAALVGVFISVTTVPAAGYAAVAAVTGDWARSLQSLGQLVVNLLGIVAAAAVVLALRRRGQRVRAAGRSLSTG
ncbi:DUF389 domain-containing protein [Amycolatopsis acidiphila]|uniref:DUF389 domain-containing protein n=1 Tax=Amycolatopsis acidiphila TaxID=715473 RepID=A0A558A593_9PSEU|nr:DUF389 domain-containing protein [Amycolatopsis acidiphila]TVT19431.1 DUF389 domain-containing protein [Amycolatopsis acidiphila]UIJ56758.1 DUF389 domain-containing protein [Amycolatopsis acidiphila]GHG55294.1 membrane protein [Amycolatopsis acidiphila]